MNYKESITDKITDILLNIFMSIAIVFIVILGYVLVKEVADDHLPQGTPSQVWCDILTKETNQSCDWDGDGLPLRALFYYQQGKTVERAHQLAIKETEKDTEKWKTK